MIYKTEVQIRCEARRCRRRVVQSGPKNRTCLSVDNFAMINGKKACYMSKVLRCFTQKHLTCIADHLNIFA